MESTRMDPKAKPLPWGAVSTERENQLLPQPRETVLKGISNNSPIKQTSPKPAPLVQRTLASSRLKIDFRPIVEPVTLAGRLRPFLPNWQQITVGPAILDVIRGYKLEFLAPPSQEPTRPLLQFSHADRSRRKSTPRLLPPGERRFEYGQAGFRQVFKQLVFGTQKGREISPSNKSKGTECISQVRAFQNGRHSSSPRSASASGLAGENRFERCVLRDPNLEGSQEILSIFLEGFSPGICMPPLWSGGGPKTVHKSVETGGCSSPPSRYTSNNISGRSFVYESVQRG